MNLIQDIYYQKKYIKLNLKKSEEIFEFSYKDGEKIFFNISIKRPITKIGNNVMSEKFYDLETAYGYGGIYCNTDDESFINRATELYLDKCISENIIAEFYRFHPFNNFCDKTNFCDFLLNDRKTVYVDTTRNKDERWDGYTSKVRNILRRCQKELRIEETSDITPFLKLYEKTMDRNNADAFYYFSDEYFNKLIKLKKVSLYNVYKDDIVISSSFFMFSNYFGHYHLSANNYEYRKYNANYFILDKMFDITHEKNIPFFHLGGGRTNKEEDLLLKFKKKFSSLEKDFYIGGKIINHTKYKEYTNLWEQQTDKDLKYFLKYRL